MGRPQNKQKQKKGYIIQNSCKFADFFAAHLNDIPCCFNAKYRIIGEIYMYRPLNNLKRKTEILWNQFSFILMGNYFYKLAPLFVKCKMYVLCPYVYVRVPSMYAYI